VQNILVDCNTAELVHIDLGKSGNFYSMPTRKSFMQLLRFIPLELDCETTHQLEISNDSDSLI